MNPLRLTAGAREQRHRRLTVWHVATRRAGSRTAMRHAVRDCDLPNYVKWWRNPDPFAVPAFLTPRFLRRRAWLVGSPFWACARCGAHQGERARQSPRFCSSGCDDAELDRFAEGLPEPEKQATITDGDPR